MNEDEAIALYYQEERNQGGEPLLPEVEEIPLPDISPAEPARKSRLGTILITAAIVVAITLGIPALIRYFEQRSNEDSNRPAEKATPQVSTTPSPSPEPVQTPQPPPPPQTASGINVKAEAATGDCWLSYKVDDAAPTDTLLKIGDSIEIPVAQSQVELLIGNRYNVKLTINSRDATLPPPLGDTKSVVAKVVISKDNLDTYYR
jgi:cytoskeletal protein RodZ